MDCIVHHLPPGKMGGVGRRISITHFLSKRYRKQTSQQTEIIVQRDIRPCFCISWGIFCGMGGCGYDTAERADLGDGRTAAGRHGGNTGGEKQRTSASCGGTALPGTGAAAGRAEAVGRGMQPRAAAGRRVCCLLAGGRHRGGRDALKQHPSGRNCGTNAGLHPLLRTAAGAAGPGRDFAARRVQYRRPSHRLTSGRSGPDGGKGAGRRGGKAGAGRAGGPPRGRHHSPLPQRGSDGDIAAGCCLRPRHHRPAGRGPGTGDL